MKSVEEQIEGLMIQFQADLEDGSAEIGERIARKAAAELRKTSPRHRPKYYAGWSVKAIRGFGSSVTYTVYNRTHPGLTHLLENGHGDAKPHVHVKPVEEKYTREYLEELERMAKNAGSE